MRAIVSIFLFLILCGCKFESPTYDDKSYEDVNDYCNEYSSHLVDGAKRDSIRNGCLDTYKDDFDESGEN